MYKLQQSRGIQCLLFFFFFFIIIELIHFSHGKVEIADNVTVPVLVGTASHYIYTQRPKTACYGYNTAEFPEDGMYAAAGEMIWDEGRACGKHYLVSCLSLKKRICVDGTKTIQVKIVDRAITAQGKPSSPGTTIVLSPLPFAAIAKPTASSITIRYGESDEYGK